MNELLKQVTHPLTLWCVLVVLGFGLAAIALMALTTRRAERALTVTKAPLESSAAGSPTDVLLRGRVRDLADGRVLLVERPDHLLDEWLQLHVLRLARFDAGGWITGTALFFTFFLIAMVLANDVGPAIAGTGKESMASLSSAVRTMGAKFVVSMVGIAMSIAHGFFRARYVRYLHTATADAAHRLRDAAVSIQDFDVECAEKQVEQGASQVRSAAQSQAQLEQLLESSVAIHRAVTYQHTENAQHFEALRGSIERLQSIEVSVQDIGAELAKSLQQTVKRDIVEGIRRELQDVVDGLQKAMSESFATNIGAQMTIVTEALQKIESAVASQAHSQVDELLRSLGDAVSGGFATESSRMKEALTRFAEVVPALETQLRAMATSTGENVARQSAEATRASDAVMGRLEQMLASMDAQQRSAVEVSAKMQDFVAHTQSTLAQSLATANDQIMARSQVSLDELSGAMRSATGSAAEVYRSLVKEVEAAAGLLKDARGDASEGARHLHESAGAVRDVLARMQEIIGALRNASESLGTTVQQARSAVETGTSALSSSTDAVRQHQAFIEELSSKWPLLARQYLEASDAAFGKVAGAWKAQADAIGTSVGKIGESFSSSATDFAEAVQELSDQVERLRGAEKAPVASRTRG